ncbi:MAG: hypothetical protein V7K41_13435 [Nostoc sp.]
MKISNRSDFITIQKMIATDVGWVEGRNPTPQSLVFVGFHFV